MKYLIFVITIFSQLAHTEPLATNVVPAAEAKSATKPAEKTLLEKLRERKMPAHVQSAPIFDLPVTYNRRVQYWVHFFQNRGAKWFREWLEKSTRYMPYIQNELLQAGLPGDLGYMVMIESGFLANASSHANAVGPWQFIEPTGRRYGLKVTPWLDERRDLRKATQAAIRYLKDLHAEFGSWYLVAASYNMGENGLRRQIKRHGTRDFWMLAQKKALPQETVDYVPKILAAMLIAKSPSLYGFRGLVRMSPLELDLVNVPGGTRLDQLAGHLGVTHQALRDLNAELTLGYVPSHVGTHVIRVPRGAVPLVSQFLSQDKLVMRQ